MGGLDIGSSTTSMRARHGSAGNNVIIDLPLVVIVDGRRRHWRPSGKDVDTRSSDIGLHPYSSREISTEENMVG